MFRKFPFFQRLISWTKPYAPADRPTRTYERYDWNSLIGEEPETRATVAGFMDGTTYFPSRVEMEQGLVAFTERAGIRVRWGCRWESTRRDDGHDFVIGTSDGEYRCDVVVFGVGMTVPWKPELDGMEHVPHYVDTRDRKEYADKRIVIIGKRNSGFELADGLLPWARQIILASPRPTRLSVLTRTVASARARYLQPYEEHVLGGGCFVLDAATERIERTADGYRVHAGGTTTPGEMVLDCDEVIAATGFTTPLGDLPELGVSTFYQNRLPSQTPYWESPDVPGVYFAGSITQGSVGLKKYGIPSGSAAVHGFRYNAVVLARRLAERFGVAPHRPPVEPERLAPYLLEEATTAPELYHQSSYLARVVRLDDLANEGIVPLQHFVDTAGPDAVAMALENDGTELRPCAYLRVGGTVEEHVFPSNAMLDFTTAEHRRQLDGLLKQHLP
jgi:thioredoxin reductase